MNKKQVGGSVAFKNYQRKFDELLRRFENQLNKASFSVHVPESYLIDVNASEEEIQRNMEKKRMTEAELERLTNFFSDPTNNREEIARYLKRFGDDIENDALNDTTIFYTRKIDTRNDAYETNRTKLESYGKINQLNEHIVKRVNLLNFDYLPNFDEYKTYVWMIYLAGLRERLKACNDQENNGTTCNFETRKLLPFDLLFQPSNTIFYSPNVVATVYFFKHKFLDEVTTFLANTKKFILEFSKFSKDSKSLFDKMKVRLNAEAGTRDAIWRERENIDASLRRNLNADVQANRRLKRQNMLDETNEIKAQIRRLTSTAKLLDIMDKRINDLNTMMEDYENREKKFVENIMEKIAKKIAFERTTELDAKIQRDLNNVKFVTLDQLGKYKNIDSVGNIEREFTSATIENDEIDRQYRDFRQNINAAIDKLL